MRRISLNGQLFPESEARVSVYDSSLMFGDMVFEMMRTFNKVPFRLREHMERLKASWEFVDIPLEYSVDELMVMHDNLIMANRAEFGPDDEIRSLINVSRGTLTLYGNLGLPMGPWVMMTCFPLRWIVQGASKLYQEGANAFITSQRTIPAQYLEPKVKNRSRLHYKLADIEAKKRDPEGWALLLDDQGFIAEGAGSNFFIVKERTVITPEGRNCLRGISRGYIMDLCKRHGIDCKEANIEPYDVMTADEAFFTCTPYSIAPCVKLNDKPIGDGKIGKLTKFLIHKWEDAVGVNFVEQVRKWDGMDIN